MGGRWRRRRGGLRGDGTDGGGGPSLELYLQVEQTARPPTRRHSSARPPPSTNQSWLDLPPPSPTDGIQALKTFSDYKVLILGRVQGNEELNWYHITNEMRHVSILGHSGEASSAPDI